LIGFMVVTMLLAHYGFTTLWNTRKSVRELRGEMRINNQLVQMLSSLIENLPRDTSIVTRSVLDMRLSRILFSDDLTGTSSVKSDET
ncbi:MAG: hypothetical protein N2C14_01945, partial [Planctomycetales bacterium]